jgi:putative transposase
MSKYKKISHVIYYYNYHIVWTPKYRYRVLEGVLKELLETDIRTLCEWKESEVLELNIQKEYIRMVVSVPPKISISELMGTIKGKTAIKIFKSYPALKKKPYWGNHFWSRGYFSSTIGIDEETIRKYVKYQEDEERREESQQLDFGLF